MTTRPASAPKTTAPAPAAEPWADLARCVDTSPDLYLVVDAEGRILYSNRALPGVSKGDRLSSAIAPVSHELVRGACLRVFDDGHAETFEMGENGPGGASVWYQCTASPVVQAGRIVAALVHCTDITARKRLEERLRRSEALMVDTQGTAHLGTWEWDVSEPRATWSEELYRIYGLDPAQHVPSYEDYLTRIHPDDRQRVIDATNAVFHQHIPYSHDERVYRPDGTLRWLHTWAHPVLDGSGKLVKLVGVCQDITDRVLAEKKARASDGRVRALFHGSSVGIGFLGADGRFLEVNPALRALLGLTDDEVRRLTLDEVTLLEDRDRDLVAPVLSGDALALAEERRLVRADGDAFWARITTSRLDTAEDDLEGDAAVAVVSIEDVTARKRAEESDLLAATRLEQIHELEEVSEWKSRLLNIASHELKNPLTPIKVQLHLLETGRLGEISERQARAVRMVHRETDRLAKLVKDLLDMAHIQAGRLRVEPRDEPLERLVEEVTESFRGTAGEWGVSLAARVEPGLHANLDGDRVKQVLFNLIGNALKFTPEGGRVEVRARHADDAIAIEVADTGPGLTTEQQAHLFRPFSQVHDAKGAREQGTGLGLYICRAIVEAHGGTIGVDSEAGHGATFRVTLPDPEA